MLPSLLESRILTIYRKIAVPWDRLAYTPAFDILYSLVVGLHTPQEPLPSKSEVMTLILRLQREGRLPRFL